MTTAMAQKPATQEKMLHAKQQNEVDELKAEFDELKAAIAASESPGQASNPQYCRELIEHMTLLAFKLKYYGADDKSRSRGHQISDAMKQLTGSRFNSTSGDDVRYQKWKAAIAKIN
jgi:hypothetical protein